MTTPTMPNQYYQRFDPAQNYDEHLFIAGRALQSAELNETQKQASSRLKGIADALFKDGDIIRDASVVVDASTGAVQCQSGAIYLRGAVRGVAPSTLSVAVVGVFAIGIKLTEEVITDLQDPALRDPATGTRNYNEAGADRLRVTPVWAVGIAGDTEFFPVYSITNGVLDAKEPPPSLDAVTQALARYDRDSSGGSYVVSGLALTALADVGGSQVYSLAEGRCRVYGYPFEFATARRVAMTSAPDLRAISNEPHLSASASATRVGFSRTPATAITNVSITAEKTVTLTHGVFTGAQDPLPDTSVLQIMEVKQGGTTYAVTTDYLLTSGNVDWTPVGAEPAPGSTYTVKYQYITTVTPTLVDDTGLTVTGAVVGTLILLSYSQKLPRIDRLCINTDGAPVWLVGVAADYYPQPPAIPVDMLAIASVNQSWTATRNVVNDGVRVVSMPKLAAIDNRLDWLAQLIAQNRLESSIHTREGGTKLGLFTDPFLDDSQRDAGAVQTAAIVAGELLLPISSLAHQMGADITIPSSLAYSSVTAIDQPLRTGSMNINPYMSFATVPAKMTLTPSVDHWTDIVTDWASPTTERLVNHIWGHNVNTEVTTTRGALLSTSISNAETLRQISVAYSLSGFGPGENLDTLKFDGVSVLSGPQSANGLGVVNGTFTIPSGIPAGTKLVEAVGAGGSIGQANFTGSGTIERDTWQAQIVILSTIWADPLAQTFTITENMQISGIDLWFSTVPTTATRVQIRSTATGFPTRQVLAEVILQPNQIVIGGASTRAALDAPLTLLAGSEYSFVILCNDAVGAMSVAELGKFDSNAQKWITSQPYTVGVLLSSSNASTWTPHQDRDLAFRILRAGYTQTNRIVPLGNVAVSGATDLLLMSYAERPDSATGVHYTLTLPDSSVITVDDGQPVQLAAAITGNIAVSANLSGTANFSPVLFPGTQLASGVVGATGTYVSRAVPGGSSVRIETIFEAVIPSGATVTVEYKVVGTSTWVALPNTSTRNVDGGFVEFINQASAIVAVAGAQIRLTLAGTTAARPRVRDLRIIVL